MVLVSVWYLEHDGPRPPAEPDAFSSTARLVRVPDPSPGIARLFYRFVGESCRWRSRCSWNDDEWIRTLRAPGREWWLLRWGVAPVGFAELHGGQDDDGRSVHIKYLGLSPVARGRGLGRTLLTEVLRQAWCLHERHPGLDTTLRVTVDTCDWDSIEALPNYRQRGFRIVRTEKEEREAD